MEEMTFARRIKTCYDIFVIPINGVSALSIEGVFSMSIELSISQMASLHGLSRQTLIYYHKIGLFSPQRLDENGNRIYSSAQIPILREICTLKSIGVPLETIRQQLSRRVPESAAELLERRWREIDEDIRRQRDIQKAIENRLILYRKGKDLEREDTFTLEHLPRRRGAFQAWEKGPLDRSALHMATMDVRKRLTARGLILSGSMGSLLRRDSLYTDAPLAGAGSFLIVPETAPEAEEFLEFPEGDYLCMYKTGMPYEPEPVYHMLSVAEKRGYKLRGDIIDICLLDATFYDYVHLKSDFCQLQIMLA